MVSGGVTEGGCDVGVPALAVDADGEVPQTGHDAGQVPGADVRGVLVEGSIAVLPGITPHIAALPPGKRRRSRCRVTASRRSACSSKTTGRTMVSW